MKTKNNTMDGNARLKLIVDGDIQGVGYRALVKYTARNLKIKGFVRNLPNGTVEIFCEGYKKNIDAFKKKIAIRTERGGIFSVNVKSIQETGIKELPEGAGAFEIIYGEGEAETPFEKTNLERLEIGSLLLTDFRDSTGNNFNALDKKYGAISGQMLKIEKNISSLVGAFVESNKNNAKLVETLISKLDTVIK